MKLQQISGAMTRLGTLRSTSQNGGMSSQPPCRQALCPTSDGFYRQSVHFAAEVKESKRPSERTLKTTINKLVQQIKPDLAPVLHLSKPYQGKTNTKRERIKAYLHVIAQLQMRHPVTSKEQAAFALRHAFESIETAAQKRYQELQKDNLPCCYQFGEMSWTSSYRQAFFSPSQNAITLHSIEPYSPDAVGCQIATKEITFFSPKGAVQILRFEGSSDRAAFVKNEHQPLEAVRKHVIWDKPDADGNDVWGLPDPFSQSPRKPYVHPDWVFRPWRQEDYFAAAS